MNEHDSEPVLKVSDRRHFTGQGERRTDINPDLQDEPRFPPPPPPPPPQPSANPANAVSAGKPGAPPPAAKTPPPPKQERLAAREIHFAGLLQDLYATGMMQLGAEMQPGQPGQLDIEGARETIDLLGLLQQKTHGNLDAQEEGLLSTVLYELRMSYVQVLKAASSRIAQPPPMRR